MRALLQKDVVSRPNVIAYWSLVNDVDCKKVFLLTNQVKEVSFKLLQRIYPSKHYLSRYWI